MAAYIEKDREGEFFDPINDMSANCKKDTSVSCSYNDWKKENLSRWKWLIEGWDNWNFEERLKIFLPYLHYINVREYPKAEFDQAFQNDITKVMYETCRTYNSIEFDPDGRGVPNLIVVFNPISLATIPDEDLKSKIKSWGTQMGLITKCGCSCCE